MIPGIVFGFLLIGLGAFSAEHFIVLSGKTKGGKWEIYRLVFRNGACVIFT
jgi:hypothetical protein